MEVLLIKLARLFKVSVVCSLGLFYFVNPAYAAELKPGEWFVRIIAEVPALQLKDNGNVLGGLRNSVDQFDHHDLKELPPFGAPYLTIVFPHSNWGENSGDYASDFHKYKHWRIGDEWDFVVKSDAPHEVTLSWEGYKGLSRIWVMKLMDLETGKIISAVKNKQLQTYTFMMLGTSHRFKWIYPSRPKS